MARRKSDAEVGPLGVWAYNTRDALDLSVEAVIAALPTTYSTATLRKVEGGSSRPGARMWRELANLYARIADEKRVAVDPQPRLRPEAPEATETPDQLVGAITLLVEEIRAERAERQEWERSFVEAIRELARLGTPQADPAPALLGDARQ